MNVKPDWTCRICDIYRATQAHELSECVKQVRLVSPVVSPFSLFTLVAEPLQAAVKPGQRSAIAVAVAAYAAKVTHAVSRGACC